MTTNTWASFTLNEKRNRTFFTAHKRSLGQGNIFRSVCQKFCSRGGVPTPGGDWSGEGVPGPGGTWWAPPPVTATAAGDTHPTGMHSCFCVCCGCKFAEGQRTYEKENHPLVADPGLSDKISVKKKA